MTYDAGGPLARRQAALAHRRRAPVRWWLVGVLALLLLLAVAGNGSRSWWARRLGDLTSGSRPADFVVGLAVGLLPAIAVGLGSLSRRPRRGLRMFVAGAVGFLATDLLAPSVATAVAHSGSAAVRTFEQHVPGYLPGVYSGIGLMVLLALAAVSRARRRLREHTVRFPAR